ncbi:uncharacterized protein N7515_000654 [Penicillium bovifimosum]|uniref:Uncharacterized protein n=1 Tax=Penicillium bovifimosum TaxID=126998 RepID=A0A9W9HFS8_9EURO|nr:uncharacterized protein N7515_000654 [Penicillium bovifimosum]KAJ5146090.1 hypothetical protein N7515_000654 [Penicillium bovifimosum]
MDDRLNKPLPSHLLTHHPSCQILSCLPRDGSLRDVPSPPDWHHPSIPPRNIAHFAELPLKFYALQETFEAIFKKLEANIANLKGFEETVGILEKKTESIHRDLVTGLEIIDQNIWDASVMTRASTTSKRNSTVSTLEYGLKNVNMKFSVDDYKVEGVDNGKKVDNNKENFRRGARRGRVRLPSLLAPFIQPHSVSLLVLPQAFPPRLKRPRMPF